MSAISKMMSQPTMFVNFFCIILGCVIVLQVLGGDPPQSTFITPFYHGSFQDYCNIPHSVNGQEGQTVSGYTLKHIDVVLTPGQTNLPLDVRGQGHTTPSCDLEYDARSTTKVNTYSQAADAFRVVNRERHGFKDFHPSLNPRCAKGHVTSYGVKQMISLGEHFSKVYFTARSDNKLVTQASHIHVESVPMHSTYQSILPFLHGLLPEKQFTKIKVLKSLDNFCSLPTMLSGSCACRHTDGLHPYITWALQRGHYMFKDGIHESELVNSIVGDCMSEQLGGIELFEHLMLYTCNNMSSSLCHHGTPCSCPTVQQLSQLQRSAAEYLQHLNREPTFTTFSQLKVYPFLSRLVHRSPTNNDDRLGIYMGSRLYLQYLITSLGVTQQNVMPLGSRLVFEVFQKNWNQPGGGDLFMRVLYNGEDVTGHVIGCQDLENGLCPMKTFNTSVIAMGKEYSQLC